MTYVIVLGIYAAALFAAAWLSRRSLGVPTLALAAGALLADIWTKSLTPVVAQAGLVITSPPLMSIVAVALTLLPAVAVMFRSGRASPSKVRSVAGALVFALLAVMLTYGSFSVAVVLDDASRPYAAQITQYRNLIITVCVIFAIAETGFHRKSHEAVAKKKK